MALTTAHTESSNAFIKGLENGTKWNLSEIGDITYDFAAAANLATINAGITATGRTGTAVAITATLQARLEAALDAWARVSGLTFTETATFDDANFQFGAADNLKSGGNGLNGFMQFPSNDGESFGVFSTNANMLRAPETGAGAPVDRVAIHEIGHGLAVNHPHASPDNWALSAATGAGDDELDNNRYTIMSYERGGLDVKNDSRDYGYSVTPMALDIAAIQAMYGANTTTNKTATTYNLTDAGTTALDVDGSDGTVSIGRAFFSIWDNQDAGVRDAINYTGGKRALINLNDATLNTTVNAEDKAWIDDLATSTAVAQMPNEFKLDFFNSANKASGEYHAGGYFSRVFTDTGNYDLGGYSIANGVVIEDASGNAGKDILIGNQVGNNLDGKGEADFIHGAGGNDTIVGGDGDDEMWGGAGNDDIDGGAGTADVAGYSGLCTEYKVEKNDATGEFTVTHIGGGADGVDTLRNIEKLKFSDGTIDITGDGPYGCPPVDFIFLVDLSGSYRDDLPNFVSNARTIANNVRDISPDSQFAVASFIDYPVAPFGSTGDYLYRPDLALTDSVSAFETTLAGLTVNNGGDFPEAHSVGLWRAANGVGLNLRPDTHKIILIATDAPPHSASDYGLTEATIQDFLDNEGISTLPGADVEATGTERTSGAAKGSTEGSAEDLGGDTEHHHGDEEGEPTQPGDVGYGIVPNAPSSGKDLFLDTLGSEFGVERVSTIFAVTGGVEDDYEEFASDLTRSSVVPITSSSSDIADAVGEALLEITSATAIVGTDSPDLFEGTINADVYAGGRGDDTIKGNDANDVLTGGSDNDSIDGEGGNDTVRGGTGNDTVGGGDGDDLLEPGAGTDTVSTGAGSDRILGTTSELFGDTFTDLSDTDEIVFSGVSFGKTEVTMNPGATAGTTAFGIDSDKSGSSDGTVDIQGTFAGGEFMVANAGSDTVLSFESYLPSLQETVGVAATLVNGVNNQSFLTGDGSSGFRITLNAALTKATNDNAIGVYEVDGAGNIVDVRMLVNSVNSSGGTTADITGVESGNKLGFFLVQDGASFAGGLAASDTLAFTDGVGGAAATTSAGSDVDLTVNGTSAGRTVFHSFDASLNPDSATHVLSGVDVGGTTLSIGFEDLLGGGDSDFQDVVFSVSTFDI